MEFEHSLRLITSRQALSDTWQVEIFDVSKAIQRDKLNDYFKLGRVTSVHDTLGSHHHRRFVASHGSPVYVKADGCTCVPTQFEHAVCERKCDQDQNRLMRPTDVGFV